LLLICLLAILTWGCSGSHSSIKQAPEGAVVYRNLGNGETLSYQGDRLFHPSNPPRSPVLFQFFLQRDSGYISITDSIPVKDVFSGVINNEPFTVTSSDDDPLKALLGKRTTVRMILDDIVIRQSHLALNLLLDLVPPEIIAPTMRTLHAYGVMVLRTEEDHSTQRFGLRNSFTSRGLANLWDAIYRSPLLSDSSREELQQLLGNIPQRGLLRSGLPTSGHWIHEFGEDHELVWDAGIYYPPQGAPFILAVALKNVPREKRNLVGQTIARRVYEYHQQQRPVNQLNFKSVIQSTGGTKS